METAVMTNTETAQALYDYFGQGNVPAILELLTDDIKWTCPGPTEILPYAQVYNGKKGVTEFFRLIYANKDFPKFEVRELIAEGDKVVALGYWDAKSKKTGNPYSGEWAMCFISEMGNYVSTENIMTHIVRQWLPGDKIDSYKFEHPFRLSSIMPAS